MRRRCYNPNSKIYQAYGGRGIRICDEWLRDPWTFVNWALENGYNEAALRGECTIDRIDVNGNYCPENCRWVDMQTQAKNKRPKGIITYNSETHKIREWAEITGIGRTTLYTRYKRGLPPEKIFEPTVQSIKKKEDETTLDQS